MSLFRHCKERRSEDNIRRGKYKRHRRAYERRAFGTARRISHKKRKRYDKECHEITAEQGCRHDCYGIAEGKLTDWTAYCHSTGLSAQIKLKNPTDKAAWQKTYDLLKFMRDEGIYGISEVLTTEEAEARDHLSGDFSFVIESDGYTSFSEDWKRPMVQPMDLSDYRFGRATHGHYPDKGPQPVFFGFGPDIREGVELERRPTVDEAPTYAKILGAEMPWADGTAITEILKD